MPIQFKKLGLLLSLLLVLTATLLPSYFFVSHTFQGVQFKGMDKIIHFTIYFILGINIMWVFWRHPRLVEIFLLATLFSLTTEILQLFIPGRSMDILDGIANISGLMFSAMAFKRWMSYRMIRVI